MHVSPFPFQLLIWKLEWIIIPNVIKRLNNLVIICFFPLQ